ncbi:MAG: HD domain-containing protein [Candidatus Omnitrophica bacterium]|nr:HD domain-containing protein [Candidatus Omnitrophota bacterium]
MVRLTHLIQKGLKKVSGRKEPSLDQGNDPGDELRPRSAASFEAPPKGESPYRIKKAPTSAAEDARACLERFNGLQDLYRELHASVAFTLSGTVHREKIMAVVTKVADTFQARPYNELLLMTYSFSRKNYLTAHIANDVILTVAFASSLGYERPDIIQLGLCAFAHDLGMLGFESIAKKDQRLNDQEVDDIKRHPMIAAGIVRPVFSEKIATVVSDIHERENGQGYPRGIPGAQIHIWAKIISVCDTFEALTHPRVFRAPYSPYEAMKIIIKKKDLFFNDMVVRRFIDFMSIYPVGMLVYLNTGEMALVTGSNHGSPTRPVIQVLVNANREVEEIPPVINLAQQNFVYISGVVDPEKEKEVLYFLKPRGQVDIDEV